MFRGNCFDKKNATGMKATRDFKSESRDLMRQRVPRERAAAQVQDSRLNQLRRDRVQQRIVSQAVDHARDCSSRTTTP